MTFCQLQQIVILMKLTFVLLWVPFLSSHRWRFVVRALWLQCKTRAPNGGNFDIEKIWRIWWIPMDSSNFKHLNVCYYKFLWYNCLFGFLGSYSRGWWPRPVSFVATVLDHGNSDLPRSSELSSSHSVSAFTDDLHWPCWVSRSWFEDTMDTSNTPVCQISFTCSFTVEWQLSSFDAVIFTSDLDFFIMITFTIISFTNTNILHNSLNFPPSKFLSIQ